MAEDDFHLSRGEQVLRFAIAGLTEFVHEARIVMQPVAESVGSSSYAETGCIGQRELLFGHGLYVHRFEIV